MTGIEPATNRLKAYRSTTELHWHVRTRGIEPRSPAWKAGMLTITPCTHSSVQSDSNRQPREIRLLLVNTLASTNIHFYSPSLYQLELYTDVRQTTQCLNILPRVFFKLF